MRENALPRPKLMDFTETHCEMVSQLWRALSGIAERGSEWCLESFLKFRKGVSLADCPMIRVEEKPPLENEQRCVARVLQGDLDSFGDLVRHHHAMIHALAYRMTGSSADADELTQETFVRAWQRIGQFRGESRFSSWLYRIGMTACLNWSEQNARRHRRNERWELERDRPDDAADGAANERVHDALQKLEPKFRAAVVLTIYDGLGHKEAARVLGCSETTVSWRVFMAKRRLKKLLGGREPKEGQP